MDATDRTAEGSPDTRAAIMAATYAALRKHGYADLTMQAIADEFDKTKAVLHYHYDTKEELLVAFLEYLLDRFPETTEVDAIDDPGNRLVALIDALLLGTHEGRPEADHWDFHTALLEIRAQAPHNPAFREQLTTNYRFVEELFVATIEDGVERGTFREVDSERTARWLLASINGARSYQVTTDVEGIAEDVRAALVGGLLEWLTRAE